MFSNTVPCALPDSAGPNLDQIAPGLRSLAVPMDDLIPDAANARRHDEKNIAAIRGSLAQFGQRRPAVVQRSSMIVRAGNGMLQAARQLGWTHLAVLFIDEDNVSAAAFAITDNRAGELADWDQGALDALLREIEVGDPDLQEMLSALAAEVGIIPPEDADAEQADPREQWSILVTCADETEQAELLRELTEEGYTCRALIA